MNAPRFLKSLDRAQDRWELARGRGEMFSAALRRGEVPPVKSQTYEAWVRGLPCAACGRRGGELSHLADEPFKALGSKVPSLWTWSSCRPCHELYHRDRVEFSTIYADPWVLISVTILQAQVEGVLVVKSPT